MLTVSVRYGRSHLFGHGMIFGAEALAIPRLLLLALLHAHAAVRFDRQLDGRAAVWRSEDFLPNILLEHRTVQWWGAARVFVLLAGRIVGGQICHRRGDTQFWRGRIERFQTVWRRWQWYFWRLGHFQRALEWSRRFRWARFIFALARHWLRRSWVCCRLNGSGLRLWRLQWRRHQSRPRWDFGNGYLWPGRVVDDHVRCTFDRHLQPIPKVGIPALGIVSQDVIVLERDGQLWFIYVIVEARNHGQLASLHADRLGQRRKEHLLRTFYERLRKYHDDSFAMLRYHIDDRLVFERSS